jgi:hypothetical protein
VSERIDRARRGTGARASAQPAPPLPPVDQAARDERIRRGWIVPKSERLELLFDRPTLDMFPGERARAEAKARDQLLRDLADPVGATQRQWRATRELRVDLEDQS